MNKFGRVGYFILMTFAFLYTLNLIYRAVFYGEQLQPITTIVLIGTIFLYHLYYRGKHVDSVEEA